MKIKLKKLLLIAFVLLDVWFVYQFVSFDTWRGIFDPHYSTVDLGAPVAIDTTCSGCAFLISGKTISVMSDTERVDGSISFFTPFNGKFYAFAHQVDINTNLLGKSAYFSIPESHVFGSDDGIGSLVFKEFDTMPLSFGTIYMNDDSGLSGFVNNQTAEIIMGYQIPIKESVKYGTAQIYVTLEDGENKLVNVIILFCDRNNFYGFKILDNDFMNHYGGIMYGMSGSPVLQDGGVIGAVSGASPTYEGIGFFKPMKDIIR